ncbi:hypothetical protein FRC04_008478 [Tulasnella sp. 424]|nr:hypothetical protein FRC04_008478 [Tulasnella sp. 424]
MEYRQLDTTVKDSTTQLGQTVDFLRTGTVDERTTVSMDKNTLEFNENAEQCSWQTRRQCNSRLPFFRLPIEILIRILSLALNHDEEYVTNLLRLSRICHYIHFIVEQTPSLWAYLHTGFNRATFISVLSMSAAALLDVAITLDFSSGSHFPSFDELVTTVPRWRSVSINNHWTAPSERVQQIVDICLQPAPMLAALELSDLTWREAYGIPFGGVTPNLSLVRAHCVEFPWDRLMLEGLRVIELRRPFGLSVDGLFSILAACPGLRRLDLSRWENCTEHANGSLGLPSSIQLPSLTHLRIQNILHDAALQLLTRISTPVLQIPEFAVTMTPKRDGAPLMRCITPFMRTARERKPWEGCAFTLVLDHREVVLWLTQPDVGDSDARLIGIWNSPVSISLPLLLQAMSDISPEQAVHIDFKRGFLVLEGNVDDPLDSLWQLRNTTRVSSAHGRDRPGPSLLNFLGTPRQSNRGIYQWPFPTLSVVEISGPKEGIIRMVEGRYGLGLPKDAVAELPAPLRRLVVAGSWDDTLANPEYTTEMEHGQLNTTFNGPTSQLGQTTGVLPTGTVDERTTVSMDKNTLEFNEDAGQCSWQTRRQCNNRLPFFRLPTEILIRILSLALNHDKQYVTNLLRLSRICHYIHYVIEQTPSLWAYLHTGFNPATFDRVLSMSAAALLDVTITLIYSSGSLFPSFDELVTTVPRWRSVSIYNHWSAASEHVQQIGDICLQPAPMLAALELRDFMWREAYGIPFGGVTPKLSLVRAHCVEFPWDRLMLEGLRELELRRPLGLSVYGLFFILAVCPGLRRLDLSRWENCTEHANGSLGLPSSIQLPSLTHLRILHIMHDAAFQLLTRISTPVLQIPEFAVTMTPERDGAPLIRCITPFMRTARERKPWEGCVFTLVLDHREVVLWLTQPNIGDSDARLIGIWNSPVSISLPLVLQAMSDVSPEQAVHIDFNSQSLIENADDVLDSLWQLQNPTKVSSSFGPDRPDPSLLNFLGMPRQSNRGIYQWPFPKLSVVEISGPKARIIRMVEGRYGLGLPKDAAAELPAPLRRLMVAGSWDASELGKIEEIVGDGVVQCGEF